MPRFSARIFVRSFGYAVKGLRYALLHEQSFRVQSTIAVMVLILMLVLKVSASHAVMLILVIANVLVLELLNTVLERFIDALEPRIHYFVAIMKDLMAAAVLVASIAALAIGCIILFPYLF